MDAEAGMGFEDDFRSADDAFVDFASAHWSRLFRFAYLLTGAEANAEDLLQTSMEKTFARWSRVGRMEAPEAYVRKLMLNTLISTRRRRAWSREWLGDVPVDSPVPSPETGVVDHALLWPLVCALPERQRAVVVLRYYEDLTEAQIAEALRCSTGTALISVLLRHRQGGSDLDFEADEVDIGRDQTGPACPPVHLRSDTSGSTTQCQA